MGTNNSCNEATGASGTILQGQGVGTASALSTATYPSTATGTGKILRADGTNWAASTATWPDTASTSGNVITSNGTNFASTAYKGYLIYAQSLTESSMSDSETYYVGNGSDLLTSTSRADTKTPIPTTGTITACYGTITVAGTLASSGNSTVSIRVNGSSSTSVSTTVAMSSATNNFSNTGLSIAVTAGDYIEFTIDTPSWSTNPTNVSISVSALVV